MLMRVLSAENARALDSTLIEEKGHSLEKLVTEAGTRCFHLIKSVVDKISCPLLICGTGNNGADCLIVARKFLESKQFEKVLVWAPRRLKEGSINEKLFKEVSSHPNCEVLANITMLEEFPQKYKTDIDLIVDGIFGFNFKGVPSEEFLIAILVVKVLQQFKDTNGGSLTTVSIDIPSGFPVTGNDMNVLDQQHFRDAGLGILPDFLISLTGVKPITEMIARHKPCRTTSQLPHLDSSDDEEYFKMIRPSYRHLLVNDFVDDDVLEQFEISSDRLPEEAKVWCEEGKFNYYDLDKVRCELV